MMIHRRSIIKRQQSEGLMKEDVPSSPSRNQRRSKSIAVVFNGADDGVADVANPYGGRSLQEDEKLVKASETAIMKGVDDDVWGDHRKGDDDDDDDNDDDLFEVSPFSSTRRLLLKACRYTLYILIVAYLLAAFIIDFHRAMVLFVLSILFLSYQLGAWYSRNNTDSLFDKVEQRMLGMLAMFDTEQRYTIGISALLIAIMGAIMAATIRNPYNLVSLLGLNVFLGLTWAFSYKPSKVKLRPVIFSVFLQFIFGYIVIKTTWGLAAMEWLASIFITVINFTNAGSKFVFSWLTDATLYNTPFQLANDAGEYTLGPPFFFGVLPQIIFMSSLLSVGYYLGIVPFIVKKVGWFLGSILGTSASESISVAGNIFIGQSEAPLLVRPFIDSMTTSELFTVMTGGFSTVAGSVFGIYVSFGIDATAILASSIMSAPAAIAISKLTLPETEESRTACGKKGTYVIPKSEDANIVHAASTGAFTGMEILLNVACNLIAFLSLVSMLDAMLGYLGGLVNIQLSFTIICSYVFWPVAWLMGIDAADCFHVASVLGYKIFANEFVAYQQLAFTYRDQISERSYYIASYALCGFSNFGSIGVQLGTLGGIAPNQAKRLARIAFSAMIAGNTACLMTACIAGIFYDGS